MENEQMKQPTYEELMKAYIEMGKEFEKFQMDYNAIKADKILERLKIMMEIIMNKDSFNPSIVKLAEWHMKQIMAKPKK